MWLHITVIVFIYLLFVHLKVLYLAYNLYIDGVTIYAINQYWNIGKHTVLDYMKETK